MSHDEAIKILNTALDRVAEHIDAVFIAGTWSDHETTDSVFVGSGNIHARQGMVRNWLKREDYDELAAKLAEHLPRPEDRDEW